MSPQTFTVLLLTGYALLVYVLSLKGMRQTQSKTGFAIGNKDMSPWLVGITLSASISSSATFVINPGFVYVHGLSAYLHFGVAGALGIAIGLIVLSKRFLSIGEAQGSVTIPQWIKHRYDSPKLGVFFACLNLLSLTFVVLILVGCSILLSGLLGIDQKQALVAVLLFVFSYVLMGGTYAHAYTNALQGVLMLFVSVGLFVHGWHYFGGQPLAALESVGSDYAAVFNPSSNLYFSMFSVFTSGFIITFALMLQPHILTKVLYLKDERDTRIFLITAIGSGTLFMLILFVGFYAKLAGYDIEAQDVVVTQYLLEETSHSAAGQYIRAFIFVALLAAGMSTLDGILVALSAMIVTDLLEPAGLNAVRGLQVARWVLVVIGLIALALAWNPPPIVGLFAQKGVYGLAAASFVPIVFAAFFKTRLSPSTIGLAAFVGLGTHLCLNMLFGVANPSISATYGIFAASAVGVIGLVTKRLRRDA